MGVWIGNMKRLPSKSLWNIVKSKVASSKQKSYARRLIKKRAVYRNKQTMKTFTGIYSSRGGK